MKSKLKKQGGFTLVEMLTVVAIIAILIAISIPMVTGALDRARKATDAANVRAAKAAMSILHLTGTDKTNYPTDKPLAYDAAKGVVLKDGDTPSSEYRKYTETGDTGKFIWLIVDKDVVYYQWLDNAPTDKPTDATNKWETEVSNPDAP